MRRKIIKDESDDRTSTTTFEKLCERCERFLYAAALTAFIVYCLLMLWLLFGQRAAFERDGTYLEQLADNFSIVPFRTIALYIHDMISGDAAKVREAVINLGGNVVMFLPLGFLLPCVFKKIDSAQNCLLCTAAVIIAVEIIQLFTLLGVCDIDDLIFNVCGSMLGYGLLVAVKKIQKKISA